jgi:hypothetical protein
MNDYMKDYAKSIVQGWPYEKLWKKSHILVPQKKFIIRIYTPCNCIDSTHDHLIAQH